jgi:hypothetical protein
LRGARAATAYGCRAVVRGCVRGAAVSGLLLAHCLACCRGSLPLTANACWLRRELIGLPQRCGVAALSGTCGGS